MTAANRRSIPRPDPEVLADLFGPNVLAAECYVDLLTSVGLEWGLLGPREVDRLWERHIFNSVAPASLLPPELGVVDVGSGAGLPGIPLALARPDLSIVLLEPMLRRVKFLELAVENLNLAGRVTVVRARAEEHEQSYDVVVCRALAPLGRLLEVCWPLVAPTGHLLALKGASAEAEVAAEGRRLSRLGLVAEVLTVRAHPKTEDTNVIRVASGC